MYKANRQRIAFNRQKARAKHRKISFNLTFIEWIVWWETNLGPDWFNKRGCRQGQYVMARNNDNGNYELANIKCILGTQNTKEAWANGLPPYGERHHRAKLTEVDAIEIKSSKQNNEFLAMKYNVSVITIRQIKTGIRWKHLGGGV